MRFSFIFASEIIIGYMSKKAHLPLFFFHLVLICLFCSFAAGQSFPFSQDPEETFEDSLSFFENVEAASLNKKIQISWNLNEDTLEESPGQARSVAIAYFPGNSDNGWEIVKDIGLHDTSFLLSGLEEGKDYMYRIGLETDDQIFWSQIGEAQTKSSWGVFNFLVLVGSLALFLYGMIIMSDGLQQAGGSKLRNILGSLTSNPFKGVLTGFGITALVQSSSVTTVMTVSFVNAGILTLAQSTGVIMGSNIGTTVTAWIVDYFGFQANIGPYTLVLLTIGLPLYLINSLRLKGLGSAIIGFALLFMGLEFLKNAVPEVGPDSGVVQLFVSLNGIPYINTILFVIFGTILTLIIQSSSATIALTMTLMVSGVIPFEVGAAMVLGENIGTTITAGVASTVGNVYAKRAARIHMLFNVFGVVWFLLIFPYAIDAIEYMTTYLAGGSPVDNPALYGSTGLAILHTTFNVTNVLILIWFVPTLVRIAEITVKSTGEKDEKFHLEYIGKGQNLAPNLSILEVKKELAKFGKLTSRMSGFTRDLLLMDDDKNHQKQVMERMLKYEEITDRLEVEVAEYLNRIAIKGVNEKLAVRISGMNRISSNLERIGDIFYQISKNIEKKSMEKVSFSDHQKARLLELLDLIDEAFEVMVTNLEKHSETVTIEEATEIEEKINTKRDEIRQEYYEHAGEADEAHIGVGLLYSSIVGSLERIGDHIINVTEGVMGKV